MNDLPLPPDSGREAGSRSGAYRFAGAILRGPVRGLARTRLLGTECVPRVGGVVVVANHISYFDPLYLAYYLDSLGRSPRFLGKAELFSVPGIGRVLASAGQIPVHRGTGVAGNAYGHALAAVAAGECVVIFPEGTLTRDPQLWPMVGRSGAARIARATGAPIVPVAIWGTQDMLAPYSKRLRLVPRRTVSIAAGPPLLFDRGDAPDSAEVLAAATERMQGAIASLLSELRHESPPAARFDPRRPTESSGGQAESRTMPRSTKWPEPHPGGREEGGQA